MKGLSREYGFSDISLVFLISKVTVSSCHGIYFRFWATQTEHYPTNMQV